ncbi:restriction endonuclease, partial [Pseudomonas aeruginosa]
MAKMWMIRGEGGRLYDDFRERKVAAIGWSQLAAVAKPNMTRKELTALYQGMEPNIKSGTAISGASQVWRFINEIKPEDWVVTYSPANRTYLVGKITGPYEYRPDWAADDMPLIRPVQWQNKEIERDSLATASKNSLGSTLTVFVVPEFAMLELLANAAGKPVPALSETAEEEVETDPLTGLESLAIERIKDLVNSLDWNEMQELVAGLLRAMGYKTQVSPAGPDRGKDIIASPDGFGFENPRI